MDRRAFLTALPLVPASLAARRALLPRPEFYWGVGIENCWIAQTDPVKDGNRRLLDVYLQMEHYEKWRQDLDLAAELGVNAIRYSVPWYKAEPWPGTYDWSWIDKPVEYLTGKLKIIPILDLIHYGTPKWLADGVGDERYPEALAKYSRAMAKHFKGAVNHYSPQNEPQITSLFCGGIGRWPPYQKSFAAWCQIGTRVAKATVLQMEAIRGAAPGAVILSVEAFVLPPRKLDLADFDFRLAVNTFPSSLAYGKLGRAHPLAEQLQSNGVSAAELDWFERHHSVPDMVGYNHYPVVKSGAVPDDLARSAKQAAEAVKQGLRDTHRYFGLPVYLTETSSGLTPEQRVGYIRALGRAVRELREEKIPIRGVNWWPLFETIQWDYREDTSKPLKDFIRPGGWNNGLYRIEAQPDGDLRRVRTVAADAYRDVIRNDLAAGAATAESVGAGANPADRLVQLFE
jgi:beta-glucosidase/6-phospho-beta-glucosidase/beta-galactosidase